MSADIVFGITVIIGTILLVAFLSHMNRDNPAPEYQDRLLSCILAIGLGFGGFLILSHWLH